MSTYIEFVKQCIIRPVAQVRPWGSEYAKVGVVVITMQYGRTTSKLFATVLLCCYENAIALRILHTLFDYSSCCEVYTTLRMN